MKKQIKCEICDQEFEIEVSEISHDKWEGRRHWLSYDEQKKIKKQKRRDVRAIKHDLII